MDARVLSRGRAQRQVGPLNALQWRKRVVELLPCFLSKQCRMVCPVHGARVAQRGSVSNVVMHIFDKHEQRPKSGSQDSLRNQGGCAAGDESCTAAQRQTEYR